MKCGWNPEKYVSFNSRILDDLPPIPHAPWQLTPWAADGPPAWAEAWLLASMWFCNDLCSVGCLRNQQINSHCWYYTPQWQRPFIILLMVTLFVHNQERLQGKQRRVEMWMEMLGRNTMSRSVPSTHTRMEKVPSFKAIWKHGCTVVFWMKSALRTIYAGSIVD